MGKLNIEITDEEPQRIKALAAMQGKSIKGYVMEKLLSPPMTDHEQQAWDELKAVITEWSMRPTKEPYPVRDSKIIMYPTHCEEGEYPQTIFPNPIGAQSVFQFCSWRLA